MKGRAVTTILLVAIGSAALAHAGVKNPAVLARMQAMTSISDHLKTIGAMVKGEAPFDAGKAQEAAAAIAVIGADTPRLFTAPETDPKSEALPAIWDDFGTFRAEAETMVEVATQVSGAIMSVNDARSALARLGQTCKSCHSRFRE